ncbi:MAG: nicotinate-nucleotide adenylyltransferase [Planctomycetes bacterium]|nr:nicotinate-nucleotide adenylyltransferase [Planctomycetota bacterium]MBU1518440.1 nicotinate-nucleotide adenylyltransferase [Planctomycetota bacterium]MBU2458042.1 nicotinate-nucleotide adenylyltransferase [Planctomycetota bacterium]
MAEKIVIFGGTFDPVHIGHIEVAQAAAENIGAKKVVLVPARRSPHKQQRPVASDKDRIAMLKLAVMDKNLFQISPIELNRAEPSYTIDTIRHFKQQFGEGCELFWLIGADMLESLPKWHKIDELMSECNICVMNRGGFEKPDFNRLTSSLNIENIKKLRKNTIETPKINISSTEIRQRLMTGGDVSGLTCPAVLNYIQKHNLYSFDHQLSKNEEF